MTVMDGVIQSFLVGFPVLMLHSSVTLMILAMGVSLDIKITPYDEIDLVRTGNTAAAWSRPKPKVCPPAQ